MLEHLRGHPGELFILTDSITLHLESIMKASLTILFGLMALAMASPLNSPANTLDGL